MNLALLVTVAGLGALASGWGLARGGRAARAGALAGVGALAAVLALAFTLGADLAPTTSGGTEGGLLTGHLASGEYVRLVVVLWALAALLLAAIAWLTGGLGGLRGLLPATLAFLAAGAVALVSTDPLLAAALAGVAGLAVMPVLGAGGSGAGAVGDQGDVGPGGSHGDPVVGGDHRAHLDHQRNRERGLAASIREVRVTVAGAASLVAIGALVPIAAGLDGAGFTGTGTATGQPAGGGPSWLIADRGGLAGLLVVAVALVAAIRLGAIPFHLRVPRLTDATAPPALALPLAWTPLPLVAAGLLVVAGPGLHGAAMDGERWLIVGFTLVTLGAAALASLLQDDVRHLAGYLVIADGAVLLLAFAAGEGAAWGPARTWLLVFLVTKTALLALTAVLEGRFETRSIPDLRGWMRRAPVLAIGLALTTLATFGLPGWAAATARVDLASNAAPAPWGALLLIAALATLPAYVRLLATGLGRPTSRVLRAASERAQLAPRARPVQAPTPEPVQGVADEAVPASVRSVQVDVQVRRGLHALRRERALLTSLLVVVLALVAVLVSLGAFGVAAAAAAPLVG
jgi:NADH:ubiquinone oxidoreductase subunit 2 (subunit N)